MNICKLELNIASLGRQEPQPAGTTEWASLLVVRSIQNPQDVVKM